MDLATKHNRARALMLQARQMGEQRFDATQNLVASVNPLGRYNGFVVGQQSLEYAIALLKTAPGTEDDVLRANAIVNRVLEFQVKDPRHHRRGNFLWMSHWTEPLDPNAVAFLTPNLVYLYRHHFEALGPETQANLEAAFPLCAQALLQREVPYEYTNIKALTILAQFVLAPLLPDSPLENTARFHWLHWISFTAQYGNVEYNSPTYLSLLLCILEQLWQWGPEDLRTSFERVLEYFYFEFAARYHAPTEFVAGAMSRAYPQDIETGQGLGALVAHLQWGAPYQLAHMNDVRWLLNDYLVPEEIRQIALEKALPLQIEAYTHHPQPITHTDYLAPDFSIGSQNGYSGNQEVPLFITAKGTAAQRGSYLRAGSRESARLVSLQDGAQVAGFYYYDPQQVRDNSLLRKSERERELLLEWRLGQREMIGEVRTGGQAWDGEAVGLKREGSLALRLGAAVLGIRYEQSAEIEKFGNPNPLRLSWEEDELILSLQVCPAVSRYVALNRPLGLSFYARMASGAEETVDSVAAGLESNVLEHPAALTRPAVAALRVRPGSAVLEADVPEASYLHRSALAEIKPNDLLLWFQGQDEKGREVLFGRGA